jgi:hypothetical protein
MKKIVVNVAFCGAQLFEVYDAFDASQMAIALIPTM